MPGKSVGTRMGPQADLRGLGARWLFPALALVVTPALCALLYAPLGFHPTDEGLVLAWSRRVVEGEVPHADFITIRPVLSAYLHAPEAVLGGDHAILLSRVVAWFELAATSWCWTWVLARRLRPRTGPLALGATAAVGLAVSAHVFPVTAWMTIDGVLLASLGIAILLEAPPRARAWGWLLLGASVLTKQTFVVVIPLALLLTGDWKRPLRVLPAALPVLAYAGVVAAAGGWDLMVQQVNASSGKFRLLAFEVFETREFSAGLLLGGAATLGALWPRLRPQDAASSGLVAGTGALLLVALLTLALRDLSSMRHLAHGSQVLFGGALAVAAILLALALAARLRGRHDRTLWDAAVATSLAVGLAWATAISIGWNTPALANAGPAAILVLGALVLLDQARAGLRPERAPWGRAAAALVLILVVAGALAQLHAARTEVVYRDEPARNLTESLRGVLPGAAGLRTSPANAEYVRDLAEAIRVADARAGAYAVLPGSGSLWIASEQPNPLPADWVQPVEVGQRGEPAALAVTEAVERLRGNLTVVIQKAPDGDTPPAVRHGYAASQPLRHVRDSWTLVGETRWFALYA